MKHPFDTTAGLQRISISAKRVARKTTLEFDLRSKVAHYFLIAKIFFFCKRKNLKSEYCTPIIQPFNLHPDQSVFQALEKFQALRTLIFFPGLHPEKKLGLWFIL